MLRFGRAPLSTPLIFSVVYYLFFTLGTCSLYFVFEKFHIQATTRAYYFKDRVKIPFFSIISRAPSHTFPYSLINAKSLKTRYCQANSYRDHHPEDRFYSASPKTLFLQPRLMPPGKSRHGILGFQQEKYIG